MEPGKLSHLVTISSDVVTRDAGGQRTHTPTTAATRWARIEAIGGEEQTYGEKLDTAQRFKVTMRYYSALSTTHLLTFTDVASQSRTLNIESIQNVDERGEMQLVMCKENA